MIIEITGTPGTGKSTVAKLVAKKSGFGLIDIKKLVNDRYIYKKTKGEKEVDIGKLQKEIEKEILGSRPETGNVIVEGHLACELRLPTHYIFVLRCRPDILKKRLGRRKYKKEKTEENILAEMLDYCTQKAWKNKKQHTKIVEIETANKNIKKVADIIMDAVKRKKTKTDKINYGKYLIRYAKGKPHG